MLYGRFLFLDFTYTLFYIDCNFVTLLLLLLFSLQIVDAVSGCVKSWIDASDPGSGNWLKYVRSCSDDRQRNVRAIQGRDDRIYYMATRDVDVGRELLLYNDEPVTVAAQGEFSGTGSPVSNDDSNAGERSGSQLCHPTNYLFKTRVGEGILFFS